MLINTHFLESISFLLLVLVFYKPVKNIIASVLDNYRQSIANNFKGADAILEEALKLMKLYKDRHAKFMLVVDKIEKTTQENLDFIKSKSEANLNALVTKKYAIAKSRLEIYSASEHTKLTRKGMLKALHITQLFLEDSKSGALSDEYIQSVSSASALKTLGSTAKNLHKKRPN